MSETSGPPVPSLRDVPAYPDITTYGNVLGNLHIWEGDGWKAESLSWKTSCYVASNLSGNPVMTVRGPGAQELLSRLSINNVYKWPVGSSKHLVMPDEDGYIANHGLAIRDGEDAFRQLACAPWAAYQAQSAGLDVEASISECFLFQVAGPTSLQVLEHLVGQQLRDVAFLAIHPVRIPGIGVEVEIELSRIGMAQTLAYEVRGPMEHGPAVFDAIYRAGQDFGIKRLGWRTYMVNHAEGGFPQMHGSFFMSSFLDAGFVADPAYGLGYPGPGIPGWVPSGSIDPSDVRARLRTPHEVNWGWMAKFDHDFPGRAAIEAEAASPRRKTVTLRWNKEDVLDVFASQFEPGEEYKHFEWPTTPQPMMGAHADFVTKDGKQVGVSSYAAYSYYYREMLSHSTLDLDQAQIGNEVVVHWGDHGQRIKPIRATVARFPYLDLPSNKDYDLTTIPSGVTGNRR